MDQYKDVLLKDEVLKHLSDLHKLTRELLQSVASYATSKGWSIDIFRVVSLVIDTLV